jgi:2-phosphoglycerate kinase
MKKNRNAFLAVVGAVAMLLGSSLVVSCLSPDTAYRVGYDIGSSLGYEGNSNVKQDNINNYSTEE